MVAYYQHNITAWMDGTESLSDGQYRAYHIICQLIYLTNGPIVMHESGIAGRCNQHPLAFRSNFKKLVDAGKLRLTEDGKIANTRASFELEKISRRRAKKEAATQPTPTEPQGGRAEVRNGLDGGSSNKPLKQLDLDIGQEAPEKKREERTEDVRTSSAAEPPLDVRTKLFRNGLETLARITGKPPNSLRSLIGRWLKASNDDAVKVLRAIEDAEINRVAEPIAWIQGALRLNQGSLETPRGGGNPWAQMLVDEYEGVQR
jgi:uncharacterized protein YdaU (DUF1376 family)